MNTFLESSVFFGVFSTICAYLAGLHIRKKTGLSILNPLLTAIILMIGALLLLDVHYTAYAAGSRLISSLLTPATICLAVPLYEQISLLKKYPLAILSGVLSGVVTSLLCVFFLSAIFSLDHASYVTLLPKSITTAIGMSVSEELGGYVSITVAIILITGILGNMIAETVCKIFRITEPVAKGIAIGTSSHAIGTSKAMEIGQIEGAMSSLSIVVSGILTVLLSGLFAGLL
ncbi:MAG: LrgB family protein [Clostridia bacterium]|nr:LrgB family protein [Clostridia bacterium]